MFRRSFILVFAVLAAAPAFAADSASEEDLWSALKSGGYIVLVRHAVTNPGIGDPSNFTLGDCNTQRNLSAEGREQSKRIGAAFHRRAIPIAEVLSSRWCRCIDTARLAFGRAKPAPMLDSMFNDAAIARAKKMAEVSAYVSRWSAAGNLILVTHAQNIQALAGVSPSSGEMVVVIPDERETFRVVGRLDVPKE